MNAISEQILSAINLMVDKKIKKIKYDITIQARIVKIINLNIGKYEIEYNGNQMAVYSNDLSYAYQVGELVYIKIPEGDFSNKKFIENKVQDKKINDLTETTFVPASPTFSSLTGQSFRRYGIVAGRHNEKGTAKSYTSIYSNLSSLGGNLKFKYYAKSCNLLRIRASFQTVFQNVKKHTKGNYGLEIVFNLTDGNELVFCFDIEKFNGNEYEFSIPSEQEVIFEVKEGTLSGIKSIKLFEEKFDYDERYVNNLWEPNMTDNNIFVDNIDICFVKENVYKKDQYCLNIDAPDGTAFIDKTVSQLSLRNNLTYNKEKIALNTSDKQFWYKRDSSVTFNSDHYEKEIGAGWRRINEKDIEKNIDGILYIPQKAIEYEQSYKSLVIYNEQIILSNEIVLKNIIQKQDIDILQTKSQNQIKLFLRNNQDLSASPVGKWYYLSLDNKQIFLSENKSSFVIIPSYLAYPGNTFYCDIFLSKNDTNSIETKAYVISSDIISIQYLGRDAFKYDVNGDISIAEFEKNYTLECQVKEAIRIEWYDALGEMISQDINHPTILPNSMLKNLWVDNKKILHYNIKGKYEKNNINNKLIIKIYYKDSESKVEKEIIFLKDGDLGTNGTTYFTNIKPIEISSEKEINSQVFLNYYNGAWRTNSMFRLKADVYRNGEKIESSKDLKIRYKWQGEGVEIGQANGKTTSIQGSTKRIPTGDNYQYYVRLEVEIQEKNTQFITIYALYPIKVFVGNISNIKTLEINCPESIKYNSSGEQPSFDNTPLKFIFNGKDYSDKISSLTPSILNVSNNQLLPTPKFTFVKNSIGVLQYKTEDNNTYFICPIITYLNTYGNEDINGWDGTKIETGTEGQYILAPKIGAGRKDNLNRFSGVLMGAIQEDGALKTGLYGFQKGAMSFGFEEDGTGFLGGVNQKGSIHFNSDDAANIFATDENGNITFSVQKDGNISIGSGMLTTKKGSVEVKGLLSMMIKQGENIIPCGQLGTTIDENFIMGETISDNIGVVLSDNAVNNYVVATSQGIRMTSFKNMGGGEIWCTRKGCFSNKPLQVLQSKISTLSNPVEHDFSDLDKFFDALQPKIIQNDNGLHCAFDLANLNDSLAFIKSENKPKFFEENENTYSINYNDFIPLNTYMIQKLNRDIKQLQQDVSSLKGANK